MPERFTADVNLHVRELDELCGLLTDRIIAAANGEQPATKEQIDICRRLFNKFRQAWDQQIIAAEVGGVLAESAVTGQPVPPEVTAYLASTAGDEPHSCGHFHAEGTECPDEPCGDYRCCIG